jgi:hypothetical protein
MDGNPVEDPHADAVKYDESFGSDPNVSLNKREGTSHLTALPMDIVLQMAMEAVIDSLLMEWN